MKQLKGILSLLLCLLLALTAGAAPPAGVYDVSQDAGRLTVRFPAITSASDGKAGDSAILTSPDGKVMVIDAGTADAVQGVIDALDAMGIHTIDLLVASHLHTDHVGGFPALLERYQVKAVYTSQVDLPSKPALLMLQAINQRGVPLVYLSRGDVLPFGDQASIHVLHPGSQISYYPGYPEASTQFINDLSLVLMVQYEKARMLFAGDLYIQGEKDVLAYGDDLGAQLFKVNHHGDDTSSSKAWRQAVSPQVAVISHSALASLRIPRKFQEEGARVLHTFLHGAIRVSLSREGEPVIQTEKEGQLP